jgi:hypothetical protein
MTWPTWLAAVVEGEEEGGGTIQIMGMDDNICQIPSSSQIMIIVTMIIRIVKMMRTLMGFALVRIDVLLVSVEMIKVMRGDV